VINIAKLDDPSLADKGGGELKKQKKTHGEIGEALNSEANSQVPPIRSHMKPSQHLCNLSFCINCGMKNWDIDTTFPWTGC